MELFIDLPFLYSIPISAVGAFVFTVLCVASEAGYRVGCWWRANHSTLPREGGDVILSPMLALVGLVIAFTYGSAISHYEQRKQLVVKEANAIDNAFRVADLVPEPGRSELKHALYDYALTRLVDSETVNSSEGIRDLIETTLVAQERLWPITREILSREGSSRARIPLVNWMNAVHNLHTARIAVSFDRIPQLILALVISLSGIALAVAGYGVGIVDKRSRWRLVSLAVGLTAVIYVIVDFDRAVVGFVQVSQMSMIQLIEKMAAALSV